MSPLHAAIVVLAANLCFFIVNWMLVRRNERALQGFREAIEGSRKRPYGHAAGEGCRTGTWKG